MSRTKKKPTSKPAPQFGRTFNVRFSERMDKEIREEAARSDQKPTEFIRMAIRQFIDNQRQYRP